MDISEPGHIFNLDVLDGNIQETLTFVQRDDPPDKYPGNIGHHPGTTMQEVLRALISRVKYLDNQIPCWQNKRLLNHLREGIEILEDRNAEKKGYSIYKKVGETRDIEDIPTCPECLHIGCREHEYTDENSV